MKMKCEGKKESKMKVESASFMSLSLQSHPVTVQRVKVEDLWDDV